MSLLPMTHDEYNYMRQQVKTTKINFPESIVRVKIEYK